MGIVARSIGPTGGNTWTSRRPKQRYVHEADRVARMSRRDFLRGGLGTALSLPLGRALARASDPAGVKVFRWAFNAGETGFDPAQINDLYSGYVVANIFEAPLQYDYLARPTELKPRTAAAMPEISADFRTFTVRIK